jgi:hypothetical protein
MKRAAYQSSSDRRPGNTIYLAPSVSGLFLAPADFDPQRPVLIETILPVVVFQR